MQPRKGCQLLRASGEKADSGLSTPPPLLPPGLSARASAPAAPHRRQTDECLRQSESGSLLRGTGAPLRPGRLPCQ
ncbi:unnamed protein product [Rangifer tarandus platyrhynchus]|uniref:Uncharacterized protein n=1 Tax=Rangifer tarandus platyrhynchus TaxID=3082113 RepID=A0ABN8ZQF3_RANTA|nr:unnamed protein product [Rangifer tarandus platyrhynchus]